MSETESARSAAEILASDPRFATAVAAGTATVGTASLLDMIHGWLSIASMSVGTMTALVVLAIQSIKLVRVWKAWRADQPNPPEIA